MEGGLGRGWFSCSHGKRVENKVAKIGCGETWRRYQPGEELCFLHLREAGVAPELVFFS